MDQQPEELDGYVPAEEEGNEAVDQFDALNNVLTALNTEVRGGQGVDGEIPTIGLISKVEMIEKEQLLMRKGGAASKGETDGKMEEVLKRLRSVESATGKYCEFVKKQKEAAENQVLYWRARALENKGTMSNKEHQPEKTQGNKGQGPNKHERQHHSSDSGQGNGKRNNYNGWMKGYSTRNGRPQQRFTPKNYRPMPEVKPMCRDWWENGANNQDPYCQNRECAKAHYYVEGRN